MHEQPLHYASIRRLADLIRGREVSAAMLVQACLDRIERLNPSLNAFITILRDDALRRAREADAEIAAGRWRGSLHGIPIAVKDFFDTAGVRTTAAFDRFEQ